MCVFCDIKNSFCGLGLSPIPSTESQINNKLSDSINKSASCSTSFREVPYYAAYYGNNNSHKSALDLISKCKVSIKHDSSLPTRVDITVTGRDNTNNPLAMLIEAKHHGKPPKGHDCLHFCTAGKPSLGYQALTASAPNPINHPIVQHNRSNFLTYFNDGVIWVDICRLMGVFSNAKVKTKPKPRLFQAFYIDQSFSTSFCNNLPNMYEEYSNIFTNSTYADYVITKGRTAYHAWTAYPVEKFYCLKFGTSTASCCTITKNDVLGGPSSVQPFCSSGHYDLYLIEIQPK